MIHCHLIQLWIRDYRLESWFNNISINVKMLDPNFCKDETYLQYSYVR